MCQFITVKELPALVYLYNNVCNDVTCAGMPVIKIVRTRQPCSNLYLHNKQKNAWVLGNNRFISRVEHDISRSFDTTFNTQNKFFHAYYRLI